MEFNIWFVGWVFGVIIVTISLIEDKSWEDYAASFAAALFWPILIPARIIRKII